MRVCDDENLFLRDQGPLVPAGDVGEETGALGVGVLCVGAIVDVWFLCCWVSTVWLILFCCEERRKIHLRRQWHTFIDYCSILSFDDPTVINKM